MQRVKKVTKPMIMDGWAIGPKVDGKIYWKRGHALTDGAMRKSIVFALVFSTCAVWLPTASSGSDKKHDPESVLVSVKGCLKMSINEYVIIDDTGTKHFLIGSTAKTSVS